MTAATYEEQDLADLAPIMVDLCDPKQYAEMVKLANIVHQFICGMPLEALSRMADDAARLSLLKAIPGPERQALRRDRDRLQVLACTQRQFGRLEGRRNG